MGAREHTYDLEVSAQLPARFLLRITAKNLAHAVDRAGDFLRDPKLPLETFVSPELPVADVASARVLHVELPEGDDLPEEDRQIGQMINGQAANGLVLIGSQATQLESETGEASQSALTSRFGLDLPFMCKDLLLAAEEGLRGLEQALPLEDDAERYRVPADYIREVRTLLAKLSACGADFHARRSLLCRCREVLTLGVGYLHVAWMHEAPAERAEVLSPVCAGVTKAIAELHDAQI